MKLRYTFFLVLLICCCHTFAQTFKIQGTIKDKQGAAVSFVSVYLKNTSKGTSANIDGHYSLTVDSGRLTLVFKAIGYQSHEQSFNIHRDQTEDIVLQEESYTLKGVTIASNGKDPAEGIMKKAIRKRKTHLYETEAYRVSVYIKGMQKLVGAPKKFFGKDMETTLDLDSNRKGILYLSESQSVFNFKPPGQIREEMISSKIAGRNNAFSFNKASDLTLNFYENIVMANKLSPRGFVSPVADNAMSFYHYKLLGFTQQNGEVINKIEVTPRYENAPAFRGIIYIAEDSWRILGTELYLIKKAGISFLDTLQIKQQYIKVEETYMPSTINFSFNGNVLSFKFEGYYLGVFDNYNLHPNFPKNYFGGEILKIADTVNKKDSVYWAKNRPIPLTHEESSGYQRKDSIAVKKMSRSYLDSADRVNNKPGIGKILLTGYTLSNSANRSYLRFDPLIKSVLYNTVEGFAFKLDATYIKLLENRKNYTISPEVRYGFSNKTLTGNLSANYFYDPLKNATVSISFGNGIYDLNNFGTMTLLANSLNGLLFEKNFSKFYKKTFIDINTKRELYSGLQAEASLAYAKNENLINTTDFSMFDWKDRTFTSNNPYTPSTETSLFPNYRALLFSASLTYTIDQKYITRPDGKFYQESEYPTFKLNYKKGIKDILGSDVDYDLVTFEVSKERISAGLFGYSKFYAGIGKFFNNKNLYYPDFQHFRGNNSLTSPPDIRKFSYLDFYKYSTNKQYFEAHFEHNFSGLFSSRLLFINKLKIEELIGINYLTQPLQKNYTEFYFGFQRLIFRATYGFAYQGNRRVEHGFRIYYGF